MNIVKIVRVKAIPNELLIAQEREKREIDEANRLYEASMKRASEKADRYARFAATTSDLNYEERAMSANLNAHEGA